VLDVMNHNTLSVTGTPTLVTGALTEDPDQALTFTGPTSFASAGDSTSLSITGSLSIELFLNLGSLPGSTLDIVRKTGSYAVQVDTSGHVLFVVTGASSNVTVTSNTTLQTNAWYHLVCVYNGNYAGATQFGKTTLGATSAQVDDDNGNNKAVSKFTLAETALLESLKVSLQYIDEIWPVEMCAVVYSDASGSPDALVTSSAVQILNPPNPLWRTWTWVNFPLTPAVVPAGDYHIGYVSDTSAGPLAKAVLVVGRDATGGTTSRRPDSVSGPSNPFGTVSSSNADRLAVYADYEAVGRTGNEGKALVYVNGSLDTSSVYSGGIADTANALEICPAVTASVDEVSIWNKALTPVQIATHYTAH
jgi:concanavalin A-like lectin/glucanase superfamily protein